MPITNYTDLLDRAKGYEGELASTEYWNARAGYNQTGAIIPFGRAVVKASGSDRNIALPSAANQTLVGVLKFIELEKRTGYSVDANGTLGLPDDYEGPVVNQGTIFVPVCEAVTPTSPVVYIHTASTGKVPGQWGVTADSGSTAVAGARYLQSGAAGSVVAMAINLP
jgi:hypothetical protein